MTWMNKIYNKSSECMNEIPDESVDLVVTSPPYNIDIQYGNKTEKGKIIGSKGIKYKDDLSENEYRSLLSKVFNECINKLKPNGSIWINIKNKYEDGVLIPPFWLVDLLPNCSLKNIIIWNFDWGGSTNKRFAPRYEYVFWFVKNKNSYVFNLDSVKIPALNYRPDRYKNQMKNPTDVWRIPMVSGNFEERTTHPAQYPEALIRRIVLAGTNEGDVILDPFIGSGTTGAVAKKLKRNYVGYDIEEEYCKIAEERINKIEVEE